LHIRVSPMPSCKYEFSLNCLSHIEVLLMPSCMCIFSITVPRKAICYSVSYAARILDVLSSRFVCRSFNSYRLLSQVPWSPKNAPPEPLPCRKKDYCWVFCYYVSQTIGAKDDKINNSKIYASSIIAVYTITKTAAPKV
jgi:hypothetical protein